MVTMNEQSLLNILPELNKQKEMQNMKLKTHSYVPLLVLDPGHGGQDPGAVANGLMEKHLNWQMALDIKEALSPYYVDVRIIQPSTINPKSTTNDELYIPVAEANKLEPDLYLSLHTNAGRGVGFESYTLRKTSGKLVDSMRFIIHEQCMYYLERYNVKDRGKKYANFYVLAATKCPAILLENLFIDSSDCKLLKDREFMLGFANEIAFGTALAMGLRRKG